MPRGRPLSENPSEGALRKRLKKEQQQAAVLEQQAKKKEQLIKCRQRSQRFRHKKAIMDSDAPDEVKDFFAKTPGKGIDDVIMSATQAYMSAQKSSRKATSIQEKMEIRAELVKQMEVLELHTLHAGDIETEKYKERMTYGLQTLNKITDELTASHRKNLEREQVKIGIIRKMYAKSTAVDYPDVLVPRNIFSDHSENGLNNDATDDNSANVGYAIEQAVVAKDDDMYGNGANVGYAIGSDGDDASYQTGMSGDEGADDNGAVGDNGDIASYQTGMSGDGTEESQVEAESQVVKEPYSDVSTLEEPTMCNRLFSLFSPAKKTAKVPVDTSPAARRLKTKTSPVAVVAVPYAAALPKKTPAKLKPPSEYSTKTSTGGHRPKTKKASPVAATGKKTPAKLKSPPEYSTKTSTGGRRPKTKKASPVAATGKKTPAKLKPPPEYSLTQADSVASPVATTGKKTPAKLKSPPEYSLTNGEIPPAAAAPIDRPPRVFVAGAPFVVNESHKFAGLTGRVIECVGILFITVRFDSQHVLDEKLTKIKKENVTLL